ncbi:MAG: DUF2254 domain-containing protein [Scytonema sp. RU_4_4]|nr:DUF2254 domain-containing protein [Scytonema sp. RU_4_4]NJR73960.1 DUF2254 domain-containing protein [Scytonema sp. CRU_2_7]
MKNIKLSKVWDSLHSSYWFVPTLIAIASVGLAVTMLGIDRAGHYGPIKEWGWIYSGGPDGARALLSTVAGSIVTVTGTAFSITIVALQLAASSFGPRLLRNFMQDTGNQVVLGTFISTFVYSLLVLRTIHGEDYDIFVPQLSVTVGMILAFISIGVLIYFIHHASTIIQASHVIKSVSDELNRAIDRLFPEKIGRGVKEQHLFAEIPANVAEEACPIKSAGNGYLQGIDNDELMKIAYQHNLILRIVTRPGKFVVKGSNLVMVFPGERVNHKLTKEINDAFILDKERTEQQDVEFPIAQLVEIALRAISPGINDPFTAIRCIDRLSAGLSRFAQRDIPSPYRYDKNNNLRMIAEPVTFAGLTDAAFNQIRQYSIKDVAVTIRLLEAITCIATFTHNAKQREALRRHADMILQGSCEKITSKQDQKDVQERYDLAVKTLIQH